MKQRQPVIIVVLVLMLLIVNYCVAYVCPPPDEISPCSCSDLGGDGLTVQLLCANLNLNDTTASDILNTMITWPRVSPLRRLEMQSNRLTKVPTQVTQFPLLNYIDLSSNAITSIESSAAFNFSVATLTYLSLKNNKITYIQDGAFQGYFGESIVDLSLNSLTSFPSGVFQKMLEQMEPYYSTGRAYVDIGGSLINCYTSDPCRLSWLILYQQNLFKVIRNDQCSTAGVSFANADKDLFRGCPMVCPSKNGNYPDYESCIKYFNCQNESSTNPTCPKNGSGEQLIFNQLTSLCDVAVNTPGCNGRPHLCPVQDGNYINENSCHSYYKCVNQVAYLIDCGVLVYNPNTNQCEVGGECDPVQYTTITYSTRTIFTASTTIPTSGPFICPGNGNYDDPDDDCEKYYFCVSGIAYPAYCSEGICFDPLALTCPNVWN